MDLASAVDSDSVSVGVEPAALAALEQRLDLSALLRQLGFKRRPLCCALGHSVGRMVKPGSERMTHRGPAAPARWARVWMSMSTRSVTGQQFPLIPVSARLARPFGGSFGSGTASTNAAL
ncbi:MAG: hypothetical protein OXD33_10760 [Rhodobacteraceae bacterium]|nr:hypothetical protein [Paracoccaceae bacterium]